MATIVPGPILVGGGGGGGGAGTFVYRPGGVAADNVFTDWATMMAAVDAVEGLRTIQFDDSLGTITIPAGTWAMADVRWYGVAVTPGGDQFPRVNISEGVVLQQLTHITGLDILNNATATVPLTISVLDKYSSILLDGGTQIGVGGGQQGTGTVPFIEITAASASLYVRDLAITSKTSNNAPTIRVASGAVGSLQWENGSFGFAGSVELVSGGTLFIGADHTSSLSEGLVIGTGAGTEQVDTSFFYSPHLRYDRDTALNTSATRNAVLGRIHRQDTTAAAHTLTLPVVTLPSVGRFVGVVNEAGANTVTVAPQAGDTLNNVVDGTATLLPGESATFIVAETGVWVSQARGHTDGIALGDADNYIQIDPAVANSVVVRGLSKTVIQAQANKLEVLNNRYIFNGQARAQNFDLGESAGYALDAVRLKEAQTGLVLDADSDTYIVAPADDNIDFFTGSVRQLRITQTEIQNFRQITTFNGIAPNAAGGHDVGTALLPYRALYLQEGGTGLVLDTDGDTFIHAPADDNIELVAGLGTYDLAATSFEFRYSGGIGFVGAAGGFRPRSAAGVDDLGTLVYPWRALYLDQGGTGLRLDTDGDTFIVAGADDQIDFVAGSSQAASDLRITEGLLSIRGNVNPRIAGTYDLGSGNSWRNLRLTRSAVFEEGATPTPAVDTAEVYALDNAGTTELRAAFDGADYLLIDDAGASDIGGGGSFGGKNETLGENFRLYLDDTVNHYIVYEGGTIKFVDSGTTRFSIIGSAVEVAANLRSAVPTQSLGSGTRPWANLYIETGGKVVLDDDDDTYLTGSADDQVQWFFAGVRRATWGAGSFDFNIPLRPESNNGTTIGGDFRGWASLYLGDAGTYVTAVSEVAPAQPNAQAIIFHATGPASAKELWVRHSDGTLAQLDAAGGGGTDEDVKVSANDTTAGKLIDKLVAGSGVTLTETDDGSNETLEVAATAATATPNYMLAGLSTDVSVAEGSRIPFDITAKSGPAIAMGTDGLFTLQPNRTYEIHVSIDPVVNESMVYSRLYNATLNLPLVDDVGSDSKIIGTGDAGSASDTGITGSSFAVFTPTVSTNIEVRREAGTDSLLQDMRTGTRILIREMTQPVPGTGGVATDHLQLQDTGSPSLPASGSPFTFDIELSNKGGGDAISYNSTTGVLTLKAGWMHKLEAWIRGVSNSSEVYKYRFYDLTNLAFIGTEAFGQDQNRNVSAAEGGEAKATIRPTTDIEVELRATDTNTGTYNGDLSNITVTSVRGGSIGRSIDGAVGSAPGGSYATSGVEYLELRQGQADTIEFQFVANGNFTVDVCYAMSASNAGDIDLRMDQLVVADGDDPNAALVAGTVDTFVPGANTNRQTALSANFDVIADAGDVVRALLERPNTDTHTGDVRVLDIRVRPT